MYSGIGLAMYPVGHHRGYHHHDHAHMDPPRGYPTVPHHHHEASIKDAGRDFGNALQDFVQGDMSGGLHEIVGGLQDLGDGILNWDPFKDLI